MREKKSNISLIPAGNGLAACSVQVSLAQEAIMPSQTALSVLLIMEFKETVVKAGDSAEMYCSDYRKNMRCACGCRNSFICT